MRGSAPITVLAYGWPAQVPCLTGRKQACSSVRNAVHDRRHRPVLPRVRHLTSGDHPTPGTVFAPVRAHGPDQRQPAAVARAHTMGSGAKALLVAGIALSLAVFGGAATLV